MTRSIDVMRSTDISDDRVYIFALGPEDWLTGDRVSSVLDAFRADLQQPGREHA